MDLLGVKRALVGPLLAALPVLLWGAAAAEEGAGPKHSKEVVVEGMETYEDCRILEAGESLDFGFEACKTLDFNIHFHDAGLVYTPVEQAGVRGYEGSFEADTARTYCLMWSSLSLEGTALRYWAE